MEMQHLLIYTIVFLCGALALYLLQKIIGLCNKVERREGPNTIDQQLIQGMVDNYRNNHLAAINKALGLSDANSVSFSLKTLKKFIADIEFYSKQVDPRITNGTLGIRFYYAAYPKDTDWSNFENEKLIEKNYAQKHTLIMIPTLKKKSSNGNYAEYDFNPLDRSTFMVKERAHDEVVGLMAMSAGNDSQSRQVMAQNHGQLIPPAEATQQSY
jgi:hypothetical protein